MKKIILLLMLMITTVIVFGQATPAITVRIANATTAFGVNISVGTKVYDIANKKSYVANASVISTATLTTASSSFTLESNFATASSTATIDSVVYFNRTTQQYETRKITYGTGSGTVTSIATGLGLSGGTITNSGTISLDTTNASVLSRQRAANTYQPKGTYVTSVAQGTTPNITIGGTATAPTVMVDTSNASILGRTRAANTYQAKGSYLTTSLTSGNILVGNGSNIATAVAPTGDVTISNTGATTIGAGTVTLAKQANLAANSIIGNNTGSSATPVALTQANVRDMINANRSQENFETAHDSASYYTVVLGHTPVAITSVSVTLNGLPLIPTTQYAIILTNKIRISVPSYTYDKISIAYNY